MAMFFAMAEDERARIIKRTHEGRKIAQGRGVKMGRKEKLNEKQKAAHKRLAAGEVPNDLAPLYGVSRATIARLR
jgi:DNA invertase Pin-like site-specific DNA recombinase